MIHFKDSERYAYWKKYDENNNCIYSINSNGFEKWRKYDKNNNEVYVKTIRKQEN